MDAWPVGLPQKLQVSGATFGFGDGLVEYQPDLGPSISRRGTTAVMQPLSGSMILTSAQVAIFQAFFATTIAAGALPFTFPDPLTGATLVVKFTKQGGMPSWSAIGGDTYQLSLSLMVMP